MNHMKKILVFLLCAVLVMAAVRIGMFRYQDKPEDFAGMEKWIDLGKEKVQQITDDLSGKLSSQDWEIEGAYDIEADKWFENEGKLYNGSLEYTKLSEGSVSQLGMALAGCKVVVHSLEGEDFYFSFENMKKVQTSQKDGVLLIKAIRDTVIEEEKTEAVLNLYIPKNLMLQKAEIELGAGNIQVEKLQAEDLEVSVEAGKMLVNTLIAENMDLSVGAGTLTIENGVTKNVEISVGAGNLSFNGSVQGNVDANCAMGNLQLVLQGDVKDFNYELQCVAGNIILDGEKNSGINEGKLIDHAAHKDMELDCAVGNMKIEFMK